MACVPEAGWRSEYESCNGRRPGIGSCIRLRRGALARHMVASAVSVEGRSVRPGWAVVREGAIAAGNRTSAAKLAIKNGI